MRFVFLLAKEKENIGSDDKRKGEPEECYDGKFIGKLTRKITERYINNKLDLISNSKAFALM